MGKPGEGGKHSDIMRPRKGSCDGLCKEMEGWGVAKLHYIAY